ncbi:hypothetical protein [Pseudoteredinibacter isoporae]|uniref:Uncharacterized protein n=1 Tax=Pseudoteredinibacter isoporae TaxID=570281 RepID=A0A7X0JWE0_9GAMM|nr:hypothetical protein [Pseudoteredinibacter isoporae]MBB6522516.1 hypothetical protein [Pseudoteredinibacter isoporae]NHO88045.1 hypothetical protein [Pseudoteredinibacter isoporae]NIB23624.1 hypothetical protein [Pseudoteredinibacter isoporae]
MNNVCKASVFLLFAFSSAQAEKIEPISITCGKTNICEVLTCKLGNGKDVEFVLDKKGHIEQIDIVHTEAGTVTYVVSHSRGKESVLHLNLTEYKSCRL